MCYSRRRTLTELQGVAQTVSMLKWAGALSIGAAPDTA